MVTVPTGFLDLLEQKKAFAMLATTMPDGSPQVTPVWFDYADGHLRINSAKGRVKVRNMTERRSVAVAIVDPDNPYRYMQIRGHITKIEETGADAHIDSLTRKYLGKDKYPYAKPGETRIMFEIEPTAIQTVS